MTTGRGKSRYLKNLCGLKKARWDQGDSLADHSSKMSPAKGWDSRSRCQISALNSPVPYVLRSRHLRLGFSTDDPIGLCDLTLNSWRQGESVCFVTCRFRVGRCYRKNNSFARKKCPTCQWITKNTVTQARMRKSSRPGVTHSSAYEDSRCSCLWI